MKSVCLIVLSIFLASSTACAGGTSGDDAHQTSPPVDDASPLDASDAADVTEAQDVVQPEDITDRHDDPCGECCPGERSCLSEMSAGICADDGATRIEETCSPGQVCEAGSCVEETICEPGETACHDSTNRIVCRTDGTRWRTESCGEASSCIGGDCLEGAENGAMCSTDVDCAGGTCRCGSDESCSPAQPRGYCTSTCTPGSCGPDEICVASDIFADASYDHCLPTCDQTCPQEGMACVNVPTRDSGGLSYVQACYFDHAVDVGTGCSSDDVCSGGTCLDSFEGGLCTFRCTGNCPDGMGCVQLNSDNYYCSPHCGDGAAGGSDDCPLEGSGDHWNTACETRVTFDGNPREVCVAN